MENRHLKQNLEDITLFTDIHSQSEIFEKIDRINLETTKLIFLGDFIDRGPNSIEVIYKLYNLSLNKNIIMLLGNHDKMIYDFLFEENLSDFDKISFFYSWYRNSGFNTIKQLFVLTKPCVNWMDQYENLEDKNQALEIIDNLRKIIKYNNPQIVQILKYLKSVTYMSCTIQMDDFTIGLSHSGDFDDVWNREGYNLKHEFDLSINGHIQFCDIIDYPNYQDKYLKKVNIQGYECMYNVTSNHLSIDREYNKSLINLNSQNIKQIIEQIKSSEGIFYNQKDN